MQTNCVQSCRQLYEHKPEDILQNIKIKSHKKTLKKQKYKKQKQKQKKKKTPAKQNKTKKQTLWLWNQDQPLLSKENWIWILWIREKKFFQTVGVKVQVDHGVKIKKNPFK